MFAVCNVCIENDIRKTLEGLEIRESSYFYVKNSSIYHKRGKVGGICAKCNMWSKDNHKKFSNFRDFQLILKKPLVKAKLKDMVR